MAEPTFNVTIQLKIPIFEKLEKLTRQQDTTKTQIISDLIENANEKEKE